MTAVLEGQQSLFAPDSQSMKTSPEHSAPTAEKTGRRSSRASSKSSGKSPIFLFLNEDGPASGASAEWVKMESPLVSPTSSTTRSTGAYLNVEKDCPSWLTTPDSTRPGYCLTLNLSERPRRANPTKLSEILEPNPNLEKYALSAKACQGILNRAERRGKELPPELKAALERQSVSTESDAER